MKTSIMSTKDRRNKFKLSIIQEKMPKVTETTIIIIAIIVINKPLITKLKVKILLFLLRLTNKNNSSKLNNSKILQAIKQNKNYKNTTNKWMHQWMSKTKKFFNNLWMSLTMNKKKRHLSIKKIQIIIQIQTIIKTNERLSLLSTNMETTIAVRTSNNMKYTCLPKNQKMSIMNCLSNKRDLLINFTKIRILKIHQKIIQISNKDQILQTFKLKTDQDQIISTKTTYNSKTQNHWCHLRKW